jgi:hypothetical protein
MALPKRATLGERFGQEPQGLGKPIIAVIVKGPACRSRVLFARWQRVAA